MKDLKKYLQGFIFISLLPVSAMGQPHQDAAPINSMISLTTQTSLKLEVTYSELPPVNTRFSVRITDAASGKAVFNQPTRPVFFSKKENKMIFSIGDLRVDSWTPAHPKLYTLVFTETGADKSIRQQKQRIGFRFFAAENGRLYLNGHPIFLRGIAINPPGRGIPDSIEQSRKFAEEYIKFMKSIHVNIIRIPDNQAWYDVCDELGMMVFGGNYSGSVDGQKPPMDYDKAIAWYENKKFGPIASHPSLMIYAMTNERPYAGPDALIWRNFLSAVHKQLRKWDSTRVYIGNAGYGYGQSGDICDLHRYWGWYYSSPFTFIHIRDKHEIIPLKNIRMQPITFTECVGNYTGPGGQYNLTPHHKNPGSQLNWTGHAPWDLQAQMADQHQCFTFKMATELFRQLRNINPQLSGVFPFTILFHNWNTIHQFIDMDPKAVALQAKLSYQPLLVSWECWTPHAYSGSTIDPIAHIVNDADDFSDLDHGSLVYQLQDKTATILITDTLPLPEIKYYGTYEKDLAITLPELLPTGDYKLIGKIVKNDSILSQNHFDIFIAGKSYVASAPAAAKQVLLYDPTGSTQRALSRIGIKTDPLSSFNQIDSKHDILVIGENAADDRIQSLASLLKQFVKAGGRILCLRQDSAHQEKLEAILSDPLKNITMNLDTPVYPPPSRPSRNGYNINPERPGNGIFSGIGRDKLDYWDDYTGWTESKPGFPAIYPVTDGFVLEDKNDISSTAVLADYGPALDGIAIAEMFEGKGAMVLCGLDIARRVAIDPVAARLLKNMVAYTSSVRAHAKYPLINSPIIWGDYASEKGILTGINSGLLLNGKPRLIGSYSKVPVVITKEGYELAGHGGGFNSQPGIQYVPYGRRPFGPYHLRGFGDIPEPDNLHDNTGKGTFWCNILPGKASAATLVWNPAKESLPIHIQVNDHEVTQNVPAGKKILVSCPVDSTVIKMSFTGDRRLVLLQTSFE